MIWMISLVEPVPKILSGLISRWMRCREWMYSRRAIYVTSERGNETLMQWDAPFALQDQQLSPTWTDTPKQPRAFPRTVPGVWEPWHCDRNPCQTIWHEEDHCDCEASCTNCAHFATARTHTDTTLCRLVPFPEPAHCAEHFEFPGFRESGNTLPYREAL